MKSLDVVTIGETMVLFSSSDQLPLEYVNQMQKQIGGAESNVAIALSRLGFKAGWISKLGDDPFGRYVRKFIRGEGVDTSAVTFTNQAPTAVYFKEKLSAEEVNVYYYRHQSAASLLHPADINENYLSSAKFLHLTGITPALSDSCQETIFHAIRQAKANGLKIVFDPNLRFKLWKNKDKARKTLMEMATLSDYILPGIEESYFLTGEEDYEKAAQTLLTNEEQTIITKLGAEGAFYYSANESGKVEGFPVKQVVDPIGAGDGFAAGVISRLLEGGSIREAAERGNAVGAFVVQMNGDVEGVPTRTQLDQFIDSENTRTDVER
ncbi:sugar kinase [Halobacillus salinarum]|uniref:Sugar kinase n=1 Tax=Halobacillus salinarum TaxID=2932257 RepID=A0ABY4EKS8_9BACI|nr:sugar kinase [Halobacillus salinarum]UOQ45069.1 sugar kinase [Halobacillus salinarum]